MNVVERSVPFACQGQQLLGVASLPEEPCALGMVIVVGGPQYRAGSHRQFVLLARRAAAAGFAVLRFDYRGMGDSQGSQRTFEDAGPDIRAAIDALQHTAPVVRRVALWGLCDGASAALMYTNQAPLDGRVAGLCLLNPWVRSDATLARTHVKHYYAQRLRQRDFWAKLASGKVAWQALRGFARNVALASSGTRGRPGGDAASLPYTHRMALAWRRFKGHILLLLSEDDYTAKEFQQAWATEPVWQHAGNHPALQREALASADHTLSTAGSQLAMEQHCLRWLALLQGKAIDPSTVPARGVAMEPTHAI